MSKIRIILAESSDILINGIQQILFADNTFFEISAKATSVGILFNLIRNTEKPLVVLGPIISRNFPGDLTILLMVQFPGIRVVQIAIEEKPEEFSNKIYEAQSAAVN